MASAPMGTRSAEGKSDSLRYNPLLSESSLALRSWEHPEVAPNTRKSRCGRDKEIPNPIHRISLLKQTLLEPIKH